MLWYLGISTMTADFVPVRFEARWIACVVRSRDGPDRVRLLRKCEMREKEGVPLLVNTLEGQEELITACAQLAALYGRHDKKVIPEGAMFWYPCDKHGERLPDVPPVFIQFVGGEEGEKRHLGARDPDVNLPLGYIPWLLSRDGGYKPDTFDTPRPWTETVHKNKTRRWEK